MIVNLLRKKCSFVSSVYDLARVANQGSNDAKTYVGQTMEEEGANFQSM